MDIKQAILQLQKLERDRIDMGEKKRDAPQAEKEKAGEDSRRRTNDGGPILGTHSIGTAEVVAGVAAA